MLTALVARIKNYKFSASQIREICAPKSIILLNVIDYYLAKSCKIGPNILNYPTIKKKH